MRAIRIHETGGPEVLKIDEVDLPPPGKGEVRIRHHAIGVNFLDTYHRTGFYPMPLPLIPGGEGAGEVIEVGQGVKDFRPGDRVAYAGPPGGYAEERNIAASVLVKLPRGIGYDAAAAMMLKGLTAQYLLRQTYRVKAGDWILVHAAAGGVGQILCQWGRALGAKVIGTVGSTDKAKIAKKAGAHHTILYREEDFAKRVEEITRVRNARSSMTASARRRFPLRSTVSGRSGRSRASARPLAASRPSTSASLAARARCSPPVRRCSPSWADRARLEKMARDLFRVVGNGQVTVRIGRTWPLAEAAEAHRALEARETTGSIVLMP